LRGVAAADAATIGPGLGNVPKELQGKTREMPNPKQALRRMSEVDASELGFGPFRVDAPNHRLLRDGAPVTLPPKAFDLLCLLAANRGRVVSKEELMETLWPETFVEEANLSVNISTLRKALGESPAGPRYIETVPKRGYRFTATVETPAEGSTSAPAPTAAPALPARRLSSTAIAALVAAVGLVVAVTLAWRGLRSHAVPPLRSVAILPFKPLAGSDATGEALQLGMADALITKLTNVKRFVVRPTSEIVRYAAPSGDPLRAGRELEVDGVLDGHMQRVGERIRVTVQLLRVGDGTAIWAETFDEDFRNIFDVQDTISQRVAEALTAQLTHAERTAVGRRYTENPEAYRLYAIGRYHWYKWNEDAWRKALDCFERAAQADPGYALAHVGVADAYGALAFTNPPDEVFPKSRAAAERALRIDPTLAEPHLTMAALHLFYDWNPNSCESELKRVFATKPELALAHDMDGIRLQAAGRFEEAIAAARRAVAPEPSSVYLNWDLGIAYLMAGRRTEAADQLRKTLDLDPHFSPAHASLGQVHELDGRLDAALQEHFASLADEPGVDLPSLEKAERQHGWQGFWRERLRQLTEQASRRYVSAFLVAQAAVRAGDRDAALVWLGKAVDARVPEVIYFDVDPILAQLQSDSRFHDLQRRVEKGRR
jgi:DNA-binding winged helix-turn-helix (wHTH) protein/TolB-like protein/Tfp pilus assembly protein PilF